MNDSVKELIKEASFSGRAIGLTSKMWIMKTGKVFSTNGQWHYLWALQNKKMLEEQFFIDFANLTINSDEQTVRLHLIKQGMFRLNHEAKGNRVTIEGLSKYFNKIVKDSILGLVMDNADDFSYLNITLFDESAERVVKNRSANFFNMDERQKTDKTQEILMENYKYKTDEELIWESYQNNNLLKESSLSRLNEKMEKFKCICITAFRGDNTYAENRAKNKELLAYLLDRGYSVTKVNGSYIENFNKSKDPKQPEREVTEETFFVADHKEIYSRTQMVQDLFSLGKKYDQDSILVINDGGNTAYLLGTSRRDSAYPDFGKREDVGHKLVGRVDVRDEDGNIIEPGKIAGEFFTRLKGNRDFAFEEINYPQTINGIRGIKIIAERVREDLKNYE
jgi:hypothetical protein